ncbi:MAG: BACON domain-containing protein [Thermoanaerobaculia bacterium]
MKRILGATLALAVLSIAPIAQAQKQRAVRVPAPPCSFNLSIAYADPISDAGMVRGRINVLPSASNCTSFSTYSPVDWIALDVDSTTSVAVTVTPNPSTLARSAKVRVAGIDFNITQQGKVEAPFIETGVVKNGTFNTDLANWGWQDRFPNGNGTFAWATPDANGSASSGSMQLRNVPGTSAGMQRLQCVQVTPAVVYSFTFAYRMSPANGLAQVSVFDLDTDDCSGPYILRFTKQYFPNGTDNWRRDTNSFRLAGTTKSCLVVFASKTENNSAFDLYVDDVIMKLE